MKLVLQFPDSDLAKLISDSTPPDGISIRKPIYRIDASSGREIITQIAIDIAVGLPVSVAGTWLYECLKKSGKKKDRVNRKEVVFEQRNIVRFIQEEISQDDADNADGGGDKK